MLLATHYDGSIVGWDKEKLGDEPPHDECTNFSHKTFYDEAGTCAGMTILGFKCIQGMSETGGDLQLWQHLAH